jgi:glycosyltransferase involved in cell wall biosynthesis
MRVALLHDYLNQYGGGERVLENLMEIFPDAPIYTLLYDEDRTYGKFRGRVKKTSFLDWPLARRNIPFMARAAEAMNIDDQYDLIISDTAGYAKGIKVPAGAVHLSYTHTPLRYAWEQDNYLQPILSKPQLLMARPILNYLQLWDHKAGQKPDHLLANSRFIADKIKRYYNRESDVIYPPVDTKMFYREKNIKDRSYYLGVGRLLHYKRFDLMVKAFSKLGLPLKILGTGPELENLKTMANSSANIEFITFLDNENELRNLYNNAKALVFPQVEDFGLVAAEAQACGAPVIAYGAGGALEIVDDSISGVLFEKQSVESLIDAVMRVEKMRFNRAKISLMGSRFSKDKFRKLLLAKIDSLGI